MDGTPRDSGCHGSAIEHIIFKALRQTKEGSGGLRTQSLPEEPLTKSSPETQGSAATARSSIGWSSRLSL